ncbi:IPTL-CTERM sorting domain-containing protein [Acidovorax lacteus]|uniref:IPTL-CTERM protein sorting domain-containing protein n=1 Tax=Acidovorax lacteus TaxID=1924988 RepID=A0ABP8LD13_9BURK
MHFLKAIAAGALVAAGAHVHAADLGAFTASCGPTGTNLTQNLTGVIGDTFTVQSLVAGGGGCFVNTTTAGVVTFPAPSSINIGSTKTFTLAAIGTTALTVAQTGFGTTFNITVVQPAAQPVPTLSHLGLVLTGVALSAAAVAGLRRKR